MDKKKWILTVGVIAVALVIVIALLPGSPEPQQIPAETTETLPETTGTVPVETMEPAETVTTAPQETEPAASEPERTEPEETEPAYTEPEETAEPVCETVRFPAALEDGRLTVQSIFQFSGMNPDAENRFGDNIAGIQMTNTSEEHISDTEVTAVLADGTVLTFRAEDVPPGKTVMAFCLEHEPLKDPESCIEIWGTAEFTTEDAMRTDLVQVSVSGMEVTVKNVSGQNLTDLNVYCHAVLDDSYFGGTTYRYPVESLPAGGSTVIYAVDCYLGMAEVVRVDQGG